MSRPSLFVALLFLSAAWLVGCGRSGILSLDSGQPDVQPSDAGGPRTCATLRPVGKVSLEHSDANKLSPRVVFDGSQFSVVWHTQPAPVSSLNGELRLARVNLTGAASLLAVPLGQDNGAMTHALTASGGELALVHLQAATRGQPALERRLLNVLGVTRHSVSIKGSYRQAAVGPHPSGHALLLAEQGIPRVVVVNRAGKVSDAASMITAQVMASLWIDAGPGGFAALLHSTNSNGDLHLFDHDFKPRGIASVGQGALIRSPSMAALPGGYAAIYNTSWGRFYAEVLNASGKSSGRIPLGAAYWAGRVTGETALVWTGRQLAAVYPSATKGQFLVHLLDATGKPTAKAVPLPNCLTTASQVSAAWGKGRLAVATINHTASTNRSNVCVSVLECL